jgi:hypothetical protein
MADTIQFNTYSREVLRAQKGISCFSERECELWTAHNSLELAENPTTTPLSVSQSI